MPVIILDILKENDEPAEIIQKSKKAKKDEQVSLPRVQKQVINIHGEIITI